MKRRKKFQWRMAALVTGVAMTCVMMTACSLGDNPVGGDDQPGGTYLYPAAANAWNYDCATPAGSTGWFLPSAQQWAHIIAGEKSLGQLDFNKVVWNDWIYEFANPGFLHKLDKVAIVELDGWNWTSSEYDWRNAVAVSLDFVDGVSSAGFQYNHKGEAKYHVRPVFAM